MSFIWLTTPQGGAEGEAPHTSLGDSGILVIRLTLSAILGLGGIYGILVLQTFDRFGERMEKAWELRIRASMDQRMAAMDFSAPESHSGP